MRKLFTIFAAVLLTATVWAQSPEKMSYQAVIRNSSDQLVQNQTVGMQISILQGSASGTVVYTETQTPTTNANGLVSLGIGTGTTSDDFSSIDWANGPYFIKIETDPAGGTSYTITGTSQLLSVPYALHAKTAETVTGGITETDPVFTAWDKSTGISITESQITDLGAYIETETDPAVAANFDFTDAANGDLLQFNGTKWVKVTPDYISDYTVTETDVTAHQAALTVTESQISDLGNYIETESDPVFTAWDKSTGISITESQISDLGNYIETESDPTVPAHVKAISTDNVSNWNDAHGWGDHSEEGYLTDYTESDPTVPAHVKAITTDNISDWNDAHGWRDHSEEGYATKDMDGEKITNLADPTDAQDAATKAYVDANAGATTYAIGNLAHGGIVFYVEPCGTKGLVAATEDQSDAIKWRGGSTDYATMARGHELYAGKMNTSIIIAVHSAKDDFDDHAALICANYTGGDFGDWYLPSRGELKLMYDNLHTQSLGGFANTWYWSSSEGNAFTAWKFSFDSGGTTNFNKNDTYRVRAVRAF